MGGLTTAAKLAARGAKVVVLEKYLLPGGSAAHYKRGGYTFDVGSSMMFGFGDAGTTNLITKALEAVGKRMATLPDPTQVHYHCPPSAAHPQVRARMGVCVGRWSGASTAAGAAAGAPRYLLRQPGGCVPCTVPRAAAQPLTPRTVLWCACRASQGLSVQVWRKYEDFVAELTGVWLRDARHCCAVQVAWSARRTQLVQLPGAPTSVLVLPCPALPCPALPCTTGPPHTARFPHEAAGIRAFYGECWRVFNALNSLEMKSLEEPR
jgi:hypothetical protein